ncbi:BsaWI family type II restriction enzyme [Salinibacter ruber]|uniref:BsaWI family type II restriction enzyme n=1 Tax=Salinibacter ruber TaxID=146919 RepID=UPI0021698AA7|nr:BsaWI family type II restriction enzyme [Salinibacter ruber]MCS3613389.1 hypothetical protein [Salinibacter ruber]
MPSTISGNNESEKNRPEQWKYWNIFKDELDSYSEDEYLESVRDIVESCESEVVNVARSNGKNVSQVKRKVAGDYFQAIVFRAIVDKATDSGFRALLNRESLQSIPGLSDAIPDYQGIELKPDLDIVLYRPDADDPIYIFSCKTSFRERLGQTGMWKLFYEVARHSCSDPECPSHRLSLSGDISRTFKTGFITIDWYGEVESDNIAKVLDLGYTSSADSVDRSNNIYPLAEIKSHIANRWDHL